jgi:hypothetical protein
VSSCASWRADSPRYQAVAHLRCFSDRGELEVRIFDAGNAPQLRHRVLSAPMSIAVDAAPERYGDGHIPTLDWPFEGGGVVAQICLYNRITHHVHLADSVDAVWRDIRMAFHFNIGTLTARRRTSWPTNSWRPVTKTS